MADEDVADNWEDADAEVNGPPARPVPCVMLGNWVTAVKASRALCCTCEVIKSAGCISGVTVYHVQELERRMEERQREQLKSDERYHMNNVYPHVYKNATVDVVVI